MSGYHPVRDAISVENQFSV